ncbi:MAG: hypothetical protein JWP98_1472, partial [Edaphobacter sp.]|nr:hypothetical protein [Edaphobacter sp.]
SADLLEVKVGGVDVKPATGGAYLKESDLAKLKGIFWANNITGVSPELPIRVLGATTTGTVVDAAATGFWFDHALTKDANTLQTGAVAMHPWWKLRGAWPQEAATSPTTAEAVIGSTLAARLSLKIGDTINATLPPASSPTTAKAFALHVTGIVSTGDNTDGQVLLPLNAAQTLAGLPGAVRRVEVSARTKPEDAFARKDPDSLPA